VPDAVAGWTDGIVAVVEAHPPPPAPLSTWHPRLTDLGEPVAWLDATPPPAPLSTRHPRLTDLVEPVAWLDATPPATEAP
jgi:hypothetical protein